MKVNNDVKKMKKDTESEIAKNEMKIKRVGIMLIGSTMNIEKLMWSWLTQEFLISVCILIV